MSRKKSIPPAAPAGSEIILYQTEDGRTRLEVQFQGETAWLTQNQMAELFQTTKQNVSLHIQNIFTEKELREDSVVKESLTTAADGKNYAIREAPNRMSPLRYSHPHSQPAGGHGFPHVEPESVRTWDNFVSKERRV
ncbi:MAG TPA: hypothetical protein VKA67_05060 [Verrucomicrobiae bacterium]|nr:hypothetical protein [Verrucomicrobiae bacterium]